MEEMHIRYFTAASTYHENKNKLFNDLKTKMQYDAKIATVEYEIKKDAERKVGT